MADRHGWRVNTPRDPERRGGTVSIDMPNAQQVCRELLNRDILVDYRPKCGVRFSPHFYNTDEELSPGNLDSGADSERDEGRRLTLMKNARIVDRRHYSCEFVGNFVILHCRSNCLSIKRYIIFLLAPS